MFSTACQESKLSSDDPAKQTDGQIAVVLVVVVIVGSPNTDRQTGQAALTLMVFSRRSLHVREKPNFSLVLLKNHRGSIQ